MTERSLISIVDDDPSFLDSVRRLLESMGYPVAAFPSAAAFLASAEFALTACLVADVQMPSMTGIQLYEHLIAAGHTIPTILITAYPDASAGSRMLAMGVECYLRKPLEEASLAGCLRSACARGKQPRQTS